MRINLKTQTRTSLTRSFRFAGKSTRSIASVLHIMPSNINQAINHIPITPGNRPFFLCGDSSPANSVDMRPQSSSLSSSLLAVALFPLLVLLSSPSSSSPWGGCCCQRVAVQAFTVGAPLSRRSRAIRTTCRRFSSSKKEQEEEEDTAVQRTSFDQAGASLIQEEDTKRMESMGDFDSNPDVRTCLFCCCLV